MISYCLSRVTTVAVVLASLTVTPVFGHSGHKHKASNKSGTPSGQQSAPELPADVAAHLPFPSKIGGDFNLIDQTGTPRTLKDFSGKPFFVFFGYAKCEAICSVALPRMAATVDLLADQGLDVQPVLITVDPERDTPEAMREALPKYHERLMGLTGSRNAIDEVQAAFQVESKVVYTDPDGSNIFSHGSYIYLMGVDGKFMTLLPPILGPERMAQITTKYLRP